ncbi:bZIP transcription factor 17 [Linum perenne]
MAADPAVDPLLFFQSDHDGGGGGVGGGVEGGGGGEFVSDLTSFNFDDNFDIGIDFDDLDSLYFPPEADSFPLPDSSLPPGNDGSAVAATATEVMESGNSGVSGDIVGKYFNCDSDEGSTGMANNCGVAVSSPASSRGSGNGRSTVSEEACCSPDSGSSEKKNVVKDEGGGSVKAGGEVPKRKKEAGNLEQSRRQKCRVLEFPSSISKESSDDSKMEDQFGGEDEKKKARLMRNRESAQLSRQRKKHYVEELEDKVRAMHSTIADLNGKISYFMAENASLRHQLGGNGGMPCAPPAMYPPPMTPMPYHPWMPCAPYVVKPQGSQVPLVPIPRLKPQQQPVAKSKKGGDGKRSETKTKKVASVSFLGLLFFVLMFGGLVPLVNVKYGGVRENNVAANWWFGGVGLGFSDQNPHGRVLVVDGHTNRTSMHCEKGTKGHLECDKSREGSPENVSKGGSFARPDNSSQQLHASLYVPRNDKLVKIDGNLIIHSVLASEKTKRSHATPDAKPKETSLAVSKYLSAALAIPDGTTRRRLYRTTAKQQKAIGGSRSADNLKEQFKSSAADGKLQQWFHQGLAGPMLSSGVCSEVFQFDVSPSPGSIVTASSVTNLTRESQPSSPRPTPDKKKHRRILHGLPVPFSTSDLNITRDPKNETSYNIGRANKPASSQPSPPSSSSMVVSVLVDPREVGDSDVVSPKSLSRVFVVVLVDSVKYVTYSCVLPRSTGPHLVRA